MQKRHRPTVRLLSAVGVFFWLLSGSVWAQQQAFEKRPEPPQLHFSFEWLTADQQTRELQFTVERDPFIKPLKKFRNYDRQRANRELNYQLNRYIQQQRWRGVTAHLSPRQEDIRIQMKSSRNEKLRQRFVEQANKLTEYYNQQRQHYLSANYYRSLTLPPGEHGIIPDAVAIAELQRPLFNPLIQAIGEQLKTNSRRSYYDYVGQFIQSIPYASLEDNLDSRGDGFMPPNQVLFFNRGDCDSKAALMASILKPIIPQAKMAIIYLPGHALFAMAMSHSDNDSTIEYEGSTMVLMEVAGPAMMTSGRISENSQFYIDNGQYAVVEVR